jgi:predicted AAA+ superfamily ATPase
VVIDEVQRVPALLNEVHAIVAVHPRRWRFALCGSSARKLKRLDVNLLAGRAANRTFFPLVWQELAGTAEVDDVLTTGLLPAVRSEPDAAIDILEAYASNYLREEIQQEALTRDLASFARFLRIAALLNGQVVNVANVAREAGVARPTVQRYFDVLVDTLVGSWLPAWQPRLKVREVSHPKFFFFDPGVARAASGRLRAPLHDTERGPALETWMLHELRAHVAYTETGGELSYYRTPAGVEIDVIWTGPRFAVGIEVKSANRWRPADGTGLKDLHARGVIRRAIGVYLGDRALKDGPILVLPVTQFLERLPELIPVA